jgi:hypothetical protein
MCETKIETIFFFKLESKVFHKIKERPNTYKPWDMTTMKQGVLHMMALPYIWFYMQEEKSIIDVIDVLFWLHFLLIY